MISDNFSTLNIDDLRTLINSIIGSATGTSVMLILGKIISTIIKKIQNYLFEQKLAKYKNGLLNSLPKGFSIFNIDAGQKEYVSKDRFDMIFSQYKEMNSSFLILIKMIERRIQSNYESNQEKMIAIEETESIYIKAQNTLYGNSACISQEMFDSYEGLLSLCRQQLDEFNSQGNIPNSENNIIKEENTIREKWTELNNKTRSYLSNLEVR